MNSIFNCIIYCTFKLHFPLNVCIFSTLIASGSYVRHIEKLLGAIVGHVPRMRSIKIGFLSDDQCWSNRSDSMTHSGH